MEVGIEASAHIMNLFIPLDVLIEMHDEGDACDVIVQMEDGTVYTAIFATVTYLHRQMELSYSVTEQIAETPTARYAGLDTPHIIVENLNTELIEDVIDNLIALDTFECHFTRVTERTEDTTPTNTRTMKDGERATQEVAAVVISDVLVTKNCN
jgi:hypothetical protein